MSKLPQVSGKQCIKALGKAGFYIKRQKGSHIILCRDQPFAEVVIPNHKTLDKGTLRAIIRQAELDVDEFIDLLDG
ncbi:MAG: type II toxin-antitoxin system HicA family toxin [Dolichospermum sp. DET50]|jgi:predicted RNA binding protein YcfA (HicA-like mRNA interferase family)|nr:type II toxin-antitoxin system HicA family toxin [Dolichospermum sp. DET66]MBS3034502.1 type II toxin-antitoxin system HicA family toxin [Dolichospermum sp. DET67]MBS3039705.1 type II toxin-antitoxin system HicA family toxin [Dolichospermum sp. DET50]QSX66910.1 MAG: type II toxin-antitoxin system HicA family toxin [Dolichospermum sp. DET69]